MDHEKFEIEKAKFLEWSTEFDNKVKLFETKEIYDHNFKEKIEKIRIRCEEIGGICSEIEKKNEEIRITLSTN